MTDNSADDSCLNVVLVVDYQTISFCDSSRRSSA